MKEQKYHIYLTNQERSEIIESLIDFKNLRIENQGCTTFGCLGTIKTADNDNSSVTTREMSFEEKIYRRLPEQLSIAQNAGHKMKVHLCSVQNAVTDCQHRCLLKHRPFSNQILQTQIRMHM